ncbi:MAG: phosphoenolpyruvate--protein phosphotransferase [Lachnospiraceae bacterium]|nr:phosphoenolpyruvate--protein phosphotransferase [Sarcina sp.]MBQ6590094.1 phosphoenolpyruvate--protein phosphotransferase [Lachnospiraceae bacterium]
MVVATGKSILNRIGIGRIKIYKAPVYNISDAIVENPERELQRFEEALQKAIDQQGVLYEKALKDAGEESAAIFEAHQLMLEDDDLQDSTREIITEQKRSAEYATKTAFDNYAQMFAEMDDPYMKARSADLIDVETAVLDFLMGNDVGSMQGTEPSILVAEDLAPSETVKLDKSLLLGMITREGSSNSHTAILARSMNLPSLIQCKDIDDSWDGKMAILDGYNSCVYIDPTDDLMATLKAKYDEDLKKDALLQELKGKPSTTLDGRNVHVYANIGGPSDLGSVKENDAEGVGLFRSEFVYLNSKEEPSEEQQFAAYKRVVETLAPKLVIIRTCDIGADKTIDYMNLDKEENPALGFRALRICLTRKEFFKKQLRALLRASAYGNMGIMFPMVISKWEVVEAKALMEECKQELIKEGHKVGNYQIGIMVETPAAVLIADDLAEEVDFFSLGTNDLTQYTCAIDRQNAKLERFSDTHHPAVLKAIQMTVEAGHRHNTWVGICGELGADPTLTETFLRMGVDELSVNAKSVLPLRKIIRSVDLSK